MVDKITCRITGPARQSTNPPSHQRYQFNRRGHDRPGGEAKLPCHYILYIPVQHFEEAMHLLEEYVPRHELDSRIHA